MFVFNQFLPKGSNAKVMNLGTFFFLYIAQTIPMTFFSTALQVMMRQNDFSLSSIALLQVVKLPWVLKFLWSPMVDRHCVTVKDYKRVIFTSELIYAFFIFLLAFFQIDTDIHFIIALIFLSLVASATQDIATDALAVLSFSNKDKGLVNSMQSMGSFGGTLIGGGVLLLILQEYGWLRVIPCLAILVLLAQVPLAQNRRLTITPKHPQEKARMTDFFWFFMRKSIWRQIGFLFLYYASIIGLLSVLRPYLVDHGYDMHDIGIMSGILGTGSAFFLSLVAGFIVRRIGCYKSRIIFSACTFVTTLFFYGLNKIDFSPWMICIGIAMLWSCYGMSTIVVYTSAMENVRPGREGTDFTVQTVLTHLSGLLIAILAGNLADHFGYDALFLFQAGLALASLLYVSFMFRSTQLKKESHA